MIGPAGYNAVSMRAHTRLLRRRSLAGPELRALAGLLRVRLLGRRRPVIVSWEVTYLCNLRCRYCDVPTRSTEMLVGDTALGLIDEMADAGTRVLSLNGGEPLTHPDIEALVRRARRRGMAVSISTNGILVPEMPGVLDELARLQVSMDGPEEIHDALRGAGSWQAARRAVLTARDRGLPVILSVVLSRTNLDQVGWLVEQAREWGALLSFLPIGPVHAFDLEWERMAPEPAAMRDAFARIAALGASGAPIVGSPSSFRYLSTWPDASWIPCLAAKGIAKVTADGRVYPCGVLAHRTGAISAVEHGFAAAFEALENEPLTCSGCYCTKTLQLNRLFFDTLAAVPFGHRFFLPGPHRRRAR